MKVVNIVATGAMACCIAACGGSSGSDLETKKGPPGPTGTSPTNGNENEPANGATGLFSLPVGSATPDSIFGVWESQQYDLANEKRSMRWRFSATKADVTTRCTFNGGTIYAKTSAGARISNDQVDVLESTEATATGGPGEACVALTKVGAIGRCGSDTKDCFTVHGTTLYSYGNLGEIDLTKFEKISD